MVIHRFAIDRRQIETAGVDSTKIDTDRHLLSGRQIVDIAVSTIITNILVVDTCHPIVNRAACKEARVQYLPTSRKNLSQHQVAIATRRRICDGHHSREVRTLLQSGGIHRMAVMIHIADGERKTVRIGFLFTLGWDTFGHEAGEQSGFAGVLQL